MSLANWEASKKGRIHHHALPMARQTLGVTAASVNRMIRQLGPVLPREITARDRYRA